MRDLGERSGNVVLESDRIFAVVVGNGCPAAPVPTPNITVLLPDASEKAVIPPPMTLQAPMVPRSVHPPRKFHLDCKLKLEGLFLSHKGKASEAGLACKVLRQLPTIERAHRRVLVLLVEGVQLSGQNQPQRPNGRPLGVPGTL